MVEALTEAQKAMFPVIVKEFTERELSTYQIDTDPNYQERLNKLFAKVYERGGYKPPETVLLMDSPLAIRRKYKELSGDSSTPLMGYGSHDAGWLATYEFYRRYVPEVKGTEIIDGLVDLVGLVSFYIPCEFACLVSKNPTKISVVEGVLHNAEGPAWEYADGFCGYYLYGTRITKEILDAVQAKDAKKIMGIVNVEQRLVAIKAAGVENLLKELKAKKIDNSPDGEYELFTVDLLGDGQIDKLLKMKNPSEDKFHYEFVAPEVTNVTDAMAWRFPWTAELDKYNKPVVKA
jgi:hypothetical protein